MFVAANIFSQETLYDYILFSNSRMQGSYFFSNVTSTSPSYIVQYNKKLPVSERSFFTPGNALTLEYVNGNKGYWQANVFRQQIRGQDHFKNFDVLSFFVQDYSAQKGSGLPSVQLILKDSTYSFPVPFTFLQNNTWQRVMIPVDSFGISRDTDPSNIIGLAFSQRGEDGKKYALNIDDIELGTSGNYSIPALRSKILSATGYARHVDIKWEHLTDTSVKYVKIYRSDDSINYKPVGVQLPFINRYADYTGITGKKFFYKISLLNNAFEESPLSPFATAAFTREMNEDELTVMVQEAAFRYYWEGAEKISGLAKENIPGRQNMIATGASGFGILALIAGTENNFITRQQATERFTRIVDFLHNAETFHGAFPHFINSATKKAEPFFGARDNGGDLVETSFLLQGLLAARAYFSGNNTEETHIRNTITDIWQRVEWSWYKQFADSKYLYWHWSPDKTWIINHKLIGFNEAMVTYLLAIASPTYAIDAGMYYSGWASTDTIAQQYRENWGQTKDGSMYYNGNTYFGHKLDVGVSNGGPLFFTHYAYLGYDPTMITDMYTNYFTNNQAIAKINHAYCVDNPHHYAGYSDSCWGLTASDGPYHYSANEPVPWQDEGKIAPTGAISSFPYTPAESLKALKNYYNNYGSFLWGEYGFRDAFNLTDNWCSEIYMGLNQAPMMVMIENYRTGLLWKLFMSDVDIKGGLQKLNAETAHKNPGEKQGNQ